MNNTRMEELARDNMPFMGLEIHGLEELTLKQVRNFNLHKIFYFIKCPKFYFIFQNLPHTANMMNRGIHVRTIDDLLNMKLDTEIGKGKMG